MMALRLDAREIAEAGMRLVSVLQDLERSSSSRPLMPILDRAILDALRNEAPPDEGLGVAQLFLELGERVVPQSTNIAHPRFLAYVLGGPNGVGPFAEAVAAALNQNCNFWQLSPAANAIEQNVLSWLVRLFGYPDTAGGLLTSGGSLATLTALSAAMHARTPDFRRVGLQGVSKPRVLYMSEEAHRSVEKSAAILGLGTDNVRKIRVDDLFQMRVDALAAAIDVDRRSDKEPFCVVGTAGTVNTGAIDPIPDLVACCRQHGLWLHLDAAYGGFFVLSARVREQLRACRDADSITLDPHKLLFAPLEAGGLLVKDRRALERAFRFDSPYLTVAQDPLLMNFMDHGVELSRGFKAFKVWCALRVFGVAAFARAVDHMLDMARHLEHRLIEAGAFDVVAPVTLTAVCFRVRGRDDVFQQDTIARLAEESVALLGPARVRGRFAIRACVTNLRTEAADIDHIVDRLCALARP